MTRQAPAPASYRQDEGRVAMTTRPDRSGGARVKGVYTLAADEFRYVWNLSFVPPQWVDRLGGLFLSWGPPMWGDAVAFRGDAANDRGATLWRLDADGNPVPVTQVTALSAGPTVFVTQAPFSDVLGDRGGAVQMVQQPEHLATRYIPFGAFPNHYIIHVNEWSIRALRVEGNTIVQGGAWEITMLTDDEPDGPVITTGIPPITSSSKALNDPDFVYDLTSPSVAGLRANLALLFSLVKPISAATGSDPWFLVVWVFDPFDPAGSLKDPAYSVITRQPDARIPLSALGLPVAGGGSWRVTRLSDTEAVVVFTDPDTGAVVVARIGDNGALLGVTTASYETQRFVGLPLPQYMAAGVAHSGDLRVGDGQGVLNLPTPHVSLSGPSLTSKTARIDAERYLYIRRSPTAAELSFVTRDLATDADVTVVTSDGALDAEVFALAEQIIRIEGPFGAVDENLWATYRLAGPYNARGQVITIELGGERGLARVLASDLRYSRLPEGRPR